MLAGLPGAQIRSLFGASEHLVASNLITNGTGFLRTSTSKTQARHVEQETSRTCHGPSASVARTCNTCNLKHFHNSVKFIKLDEGHSD